MEIKNNLSKIIGLSFMLTIGPGLVFAVVLFFGFEHFTGIEVAPLLLFIFGYAIALPFTFAFLALKTPSKVIFNQESIRIHYLFFGTKEILPTDIAGIQSSQGSGPDVKLSFETKRGKNFSVLIDVYRSKPLLEYIDNLGLTIF